MSTQMNLFTNYNSTVTPVRISSQTQLPQCVWDWLYTLAKDEDIKPLFRYGQIGTLSTVISAVIDVYWVHFNSVNGIVWDNSLHNRFIKDCNDIKPKRASTNFNVRAVIGDKMYLCADTAQYAKPKYFDSVGMSSVVSCMIYAVYCMQTDRNKKTK